MDNDTLSVNADNDGETKKTESKKSGILFCSSIEEAMTAAVPQGSAVKAIGYDCTDKLLRLGYRLTESNTDADAVIARGGEREFSAARKLCCEKTVLVPTHAYAAVSSDMYRTEDGKFAVMKAGGRIFAAVFDAGEVDSNLASIYGELVALDLCAYDFTFGMYMRGEAVDVAPATEIGAIIDAVTDRLKNSVKNRERAAAILAEAGMQAAKTVEKYPRLLHCSGAAQMSEAIRMLYAAEERPLGMRGETEMLLAAFVTDYYIKSLSDGRAEFPPDNNKRIDSLCEYFRTDVRRACVHVSPIYPPIKMRLCEYRRSEFRSEQQRLLAAVKRRQTAAWPIFKRLYPDDGFGLRSLVDRSDLGICLALAPDVFAADTMLSFLKQTGRLDRYIV